MTYYPLRGRTRLPGLIDEKVRLVEYTDGLDYTRISGSAYLYLEQRVLINVDVQVLAIYWDLRAGTYQLSINGVDYGNPHTLASTMDDEEWDLSSSGIKFSKGNYYNIRMTRTGDDNWLDNSVTITHVGVLWTDIYLSYGGAQFTDYIAPLKIKGLYLP